MAGSGHPIIVPTLPSLASRTIPVPLLPGSSSSFNLGDNEKRWLVVGICLNKLLLPTLRQSIAPEIGKHYNHHKTAYNIHSQTFPHQLVKENRVGFEFKYGSVNNNFTNHKNKKKGYNYDVSSPVEFARLYLLPAMAKFTGFDDTCDISATLGILASASVFSTPLQSSAKDVRQNVRNEWGHCNFRNWDQFKFARCFQLMETLVRNLNLTPADEKTTVDEIKDWEMKGQQLCMGKLVDEELLKLVSVEVEQLSRDLEGMTQTNREEALLVTAEMEKVQQAIAQYDKQIMEQTQRIDDLSDACADLSVNVELVHTEQQEIKADVTTLKKGQDNLQEEVCTVKTEHLNLVDRVDTVEVKQEHLEDRVDNLERVIDSGAGLRPVNTFQAPNRVPCFCGRIEELDFLAKPLEKQEPPCSFSVISGLGGTGKTSLALEHVWRNKDRYDGGVYWISGESKRLFQVTLTEMARYIGTSADDVSQTLSNTLDWLQMRKQYWCLVVDNLDELELSDDMMKLLNGQWKRIATGHVIITTRRETKLIPEDIQDIEDDCCLELTSLTESDSVLFMKMKTNRNQTDEEPVITELVRELGCLPLALDQAGAYIRHLGCTFSDYKKEYEKKKLKLLKTKKAFYISSEDRRSVQTTWQLNFDYVVQRSEDMGLGRSASLVMNISAFLSPDDIPHEIINEGLPPVAEESLRESASSSLSVSQLLTLLTNFSLFQRFTDRSYSVHRVVQEVIRNKIAREDIVEVFGSAIRMLNFAFSSAKTPVEVCKNFEGDAVFIEKNPPSLQVWGKLSAHACTLQEHLLAYSKINPSSNESLLYTPEAARLLNEAAVFLSACREKVKAQELQRLKLEVLVQTPNPPTKEDLDYLEYFEVPLKDMDYKRISHCMVALVQNEKVSDDDEVSALQEKVDALRASGNSAVKEQDFRRALDFYTEGTSLDATDHRLFANRALCHLKLNQPSEALEDCEKCLKLERNYGKALQRKAWALHELATQSPSDKHLKGRSLAAAALASHIDPDAGKGSLFKRMFPNLLFFEVKNSLELTTLLLMGFPHATLLLHDGYYELQEAIFNEDTQIVGIGPRVSIKCECRCEIWRANCCFENIAFAKESIAVVCQIGGSLTLLGCDVSGGSVGCEDFPDCNGGPGCIADRFVGRRPCNREGMYGDQSSRPSGLVGYAGVQMSTGSTGYLKDCDIHHCGGGGVLCVNPGSSMSVISCRIHGNRQTGLEAREGAYLIAKDCDIFANYYHGILLGPSAASCEIINNRIFENRKEGILHWVSIEHKTTIKGNRIYHNRPYGISLEHCSVEISQNEIFENGFYAILAKSKTTAYIGENEIYSNKCGGIQIGINYSGRVVIDSNTVRDHSGPWLSASVCDDEVCPDLKTISADHPHLPPGETTMYTTPPIDTNNTLRNNEEGMHHPKDRMHKIARQCAFCRRSGKLLRCVKCNIAEYCNQSCQISHWPNHKALCAAMAGRYSITLPFKSFAETRPFHVRTFGSHLKGIGKGPKPDPKSNKRFIVKIQSLHLNSHPRQLLTVYDKSLFIDGQVESPEIFQIIMECGVLGGLHKITSKKIFLWATFADGVKTLTFHLDQLAPYQKW